MQDQDNTGRTDEVVMALKRRDLDSAPISKNERALLEFARLLTETPARTSDDNVEHLRQAGWSDEQIAEAVYVIGMFAFFNRVADAFGLADPNYGEMLGEQGEPATFPTS